MKIILLTFLIFFSSVLRANEISPEKIQLIEQYLEVTDTKKHLVMVANDTAKSILEAINKHSNDPLNNTEIDELSILIIDFFSENADNIIRTSIPVIDKYYSITELEQLIEVYSLEIMKKTLRITPLLYRDMSHNMQNWINTHQYLIEQKIRTYLEEKNRTYSENETT